MQSTVSFLIYFIQIFSELLTFLIFARVVLSWVNPAKNKFTNFIYGASDPILAPFKRLIPNIGMIDISPIVCLFAISFITRTIISLLALLI